MLFGWESQRVNPGNRRKQPEEPSLQTKAPAVTLHSVNLETSRLPEVTTLLGDLKPKFPDSLIPCMYIALRMPKYSLVHG